MICLLFKIFKSIDNLGVLTGELWKEDDSPGQVGTLPRAAMWAQFLRCEQAGHRPLTSQ